MAQMSIRMDADQYARIQSAARSSGNSMESWARDLLLAAALAPATPERYGIHGRVPGRVTLKRFGARPNETVVSGEGWTLDAADAVKEAEELVRRNEPGDRESAVTLLKAHFEIVVEMGLSS